MNKNTADIKKRLNNVAGQINGIVRMIDEEKECLAIITQLKAAKAGLAKASTIIVQSYLTKCLKEGRNSTVSKAEVEKLILELAR